MEGRHVPGRPVPVALGALVLPGRQAAPQPADGPGGGLDGEPGYRHLGLLADPGEIRRQVAEIEGEVAVGQGPPATGGAGPPPGRASPFQPPGAPPPAPRPPRAQRGAQGPPRGPPQGTPPPQP